MNDMRSEAERMVALESTLPRGMQRPATGEPDLLAQLNALYEEIAACKRHPRMELSRYEKVWIGLCDASDGIHDALDGWPV